jgi:hypothetical protein
MHCTLLGSKPWKIFNDLVDARIRKVMNVEKEKDELEDFDGNPFSRY